MANSSSEIQLIINGNAEGAMKTLGDVGKQIEDMTKMFSDFGKTVGDISKQVMDFSKSFGGFSTAEKDMSGVSKTANDVTKAIDNMSKVTSEQTVLMNHDFGSLTKTVEDSGTNIVHSLEGVVREIRAVNVSLDGMATKAQQTGEKTSKAIDYAGLLIGGEQLKNFGEKIVGFFVESVKAGVEFNQTMANTRAALDSQPGAIKASNDEMQKMSGLALDVGKNGFYSANQVGEAMSTLARNGLNANRIMNGAIQQTANVAAANQQDIDETAMTISDIFNELGSNIVKKFGGNVTKAFQYISDVMTQTLHASKISMTDFFNTMKYAGSIASNAGMSFGDLGGAIALLGSHAIRGSQAGTTLRRMLTNLTPASKAAQAEMESLGMVTANGGNIFYTASGKLKSMSDIQQILHDKLSKLTPQMQTFAEKTIFGQYALNGMSIIANESPAAFQKLEASMNKAGATMTALHDRQQGWAYTWMKLQAEFQTIEKEIGLALKPVVDALSNALAAMMKWWDGLSPSTQKWIIYGVGAVGVITLLAGVVMTAVAGFGFLLMGLEAAGTALAAVGSVALPVIAVIAAIGVAVYELVKHWNVVKQVTLDVWNAIKQVIDSVWSYIGPTIINGIKAVEKWWKSIWPELSQVLKVVFGIIGGLIATMLLPTFIVIKTVLSALASDWHNIWNLIVAILKMAWDTIVTVIKVAWDIFSGIIQVALDLLTGHWSAAWSHLKNMVVNVWTDMKNGVGKIAGDLGNVVMDAIHALVGGVTGLFNGLVNTVKGVWNTITGIFGGGHKSSTPTVNVPVPSVTGRGAIPKYATGGIATHPQLALVGENEPEYIIPKSKMSDLSFLSQFAVPNSNPLPSGRFNGVGGNTIHINGPINIVTQATDARGISAAIKTQLSRALT